MLLFKAITDLFCRCERRYVSDLCCAVKWVGMRSRGPCLCGHTSAGYGVGGGVRCGGGRSNFSLRVWVGVMVLYPV